MDGYRRVKISRITKDNGMIDMGFEDSCVAIVGEEKYFTAFGVPISRLVVGQELWIKGTLDNSDAGLAMPNPLADLMLA